MVEDKNLNISQKITLFVKNNMTNIALILVCFAYIFYGMLTVEKTGKTISEIVGGGLISAVTGFLIKTLRRKSGIQDGMISPVFIAKINAYGQKKVEISPYISELPQFCNYKNATRLKQKQAEYLVRYSMDYDLFMQGYYDNDKTKKKILEKVRKMEVYQYTPVTFTNAYDNATEEEDILSTNVKKYESKDTISKILTTVVCGFLFGYYTVGQEISMTNVTWAILQISLYLIMGQIDYNNSYYYVTQTLRGKIERVICVLDEFLILRNKYKDMFQVNLKSEKIPNTNVKKSPENEDLITEGNVIFSQKSKENEVKENV